MIGISSKTVNKSNDRKTDCTANSGMKRVQTSTKAYRRLTHFDGGLRLYTRTVGYGIHHLAESCEQRPPFEL